MTVAPTWDVGGRVLSYRWFDSADKTTGFVLLRIFKLIFGAVTLNTENEILFAPHTSQLVTSALQYALESKDPQNYLMLLKGMFQRLKPSDERKFELLHKEFIPLIPGTQPLQYPVAARPCGGSARACGRVRVYVRVFFLSDHVFICEPGGVVRRYHH